MPLLFSHTVYQSYPQSFVTKGRWDRLLAWYDSLAAQSVSDAVDLDGVENIDDFAEALTRAGVSPDVTSGTSGKVSLLNNTVGDRERSHRIGAAILGWPRPLRTYRSMRFYALGPSRGYSKHIEFSHSLGEIFGAPDHIRFLTDEPMLPSQAARAAQMRSRMIDGSATPEEVSAFEAEVQDRTARQARNLHDLASDIADLRREPMVVMGVWTQHWAIMERAHELGFGDGEFHPDSCVYLLGGLKGVSLPPDYREQIYRFYGDVHRFMTYGMTEIDPTAPICEAGRYHRPPWLMWLVLDQAGERLAEPGADGILDGRFAVLSFNNEGRWAGLISGDHVRMRTAVRLRASRSDDPRRRRPLQRAGGRRRQDRVRRIDGGLHERGGGNITTDAAAPAVPVCHVVRGRIVEGGEVEYGPRDGARFADAQARARRAARGRAASRRPRSASR